MVQFMSTIWNFHLNWADTICIEKLITFSLIVKIIHVYQGCIGLNRSALRHVYRKHPYPSDHWSLPYISPDYTKKESIIIFKMYLKQHHAHKITSISLCVNLQTFVAHKVLQIFCQQTVQWIICRTFSIFWRTHNHAVTHIIKTSWNIS